MKGALAVLVVLGMALAGCSSGGGDVVVVDSADPGAGAPVQNISVPAKKTGQEGHIAGYVVDQAFHILEGINVTLPAFGLVDKTDRKGEFAFVDLPAGSYLLSVKEPGYQTVRTIIDVKEDEFTRLQIILRAVPPPSPYHETWTHQGIARVTSADPPIFQVHWDDRFMANASSGIHTIILEAYMDEYAGAAGGTNGFTYEIEDARTSTTITRGRSVNPLHVEVQVSGTDAVREVYGFRVTPYGDPVPETDKEFEAFATLFHNGPPPDDWSIRDA